MDRFFCEPQLAVAQTDWWSVGCLDGGRAALRVQTLRLNGLARFGHFPGIAGLQNRRDPAFAANHMIGNIDREAGTGILARVAENGSVRISVSFL